MNKRSDTIAAISTPYGRGGIGIIRISGPDAITIAAEVTKTAYPLPSLAQASSRKLVHAYLTDQSSNSLDEILIAVMPAGRSYTGELCVELNCHGGTAVVACALERVLQAGARIAEPGEFTRRAVENGRIDLVQAEAVNELINARSRIAMKIAWQHFAGGLSRRFEDLRDKIKDALSDIIYRIDVDLDERNDREELLRIREKITALSSSVKDMLATAENKKYLTQGYWVTIAGPPNAGKSSIFNSLLKIERSIVCDIPGTTRDHVSESIDINGIEVRLIDTAGIRESSDEIEKISVQRSMEQIRSADIIIYVLDQAQEWPDEDFEKAEEILSINGMIILNKADLSVSKKAGLFQRKHGNVNVIRVSALKGENIDRIKEWLAARLHSIANLENIIITNTRHIQLLKNTQAHLEAAIKLLNENRPLDIVQFEIEKSVAMLEEILGVISSEEAWDNIFNKFCVGK
jgi:tRNA modification GTPase